MWSEMPGIVSLLIQGCSPFVKVKYYAAKEAHSVLIVCNEYWTNWISHSGENGHTVPLCNTGADMNVR